MSPAIISRTLSLIPERVPRMHSGSIFDPTASTCCAHPDRIAHLAQFLGWLRPLHPITKDDLVGFNLMTPYGKPTVAAVADEGESDAEPQIESEAEFNRA